LSSKSKYTLRNGYNCRAVENLQGIVVLTLSDQLTLQECFEPEAFDKADVCLPLWGTLRVVASDGACWATVTGFTPLGNVVLVPDGQAIVEPAKAPKRRAA
jgi:hypothetical protein